MKSIKHFLLSVILLCTFSCKDENKDIAFNNTPTFSIDYEKYELENGLDIVLHEDKSDPIVAIAVVVHAGSNRETTGRTGFAHFFEHMLFKKSENVPEGYFWDKIPEWGGTFNGTTNKDRTLYFETVPKNVLEKLLWMEADRLGFFINAVDPKGFETEKQVVQNEKRQRVDNVPYGHTDYVTIKALYPESHPYNWTTIGELEDLQNSTLDDVKSFYDKWYGPQNSTLVIAGDFDKNQVKQWIEKYFGEIKKHGVKAEIKPMPITLNETKSLYHEDYFAKLPRLTLNFPTVEQYHPDSYALDVLSSLLTDGKSSAIYKKLVLEDQLASNVISYNYSQEIAGRFVVRVDANDGVDLDETKKSVFEALKDFETNDISDKDLARVKARLETDFYNRISGVQGKSFHLAHGNMYKNDPGYLEKELMSWQNVTKEDVKRVYNKYIKGQHYLATSFVPKGQLKLALEDAKKAYVKEEPLVPYQPKELPESKISNTKTPSKIDRTIEPGFGEHLTLKSPKIWESELENGLKILGIKSNELPMVTFSLKIKGGMQLDHPDKIGVANLMTDIMMEGTKNKTPEELENAIKDLGANIWMSTSSENITISANCLAKNYTKVLQLIEEILLEPRWDATEFKRIKDEALINIKQRDVNPNAVASMVRNKLLYGNGINGNHTLGTEKSLGKIALEDLIAFYNTNYAPNVSTFHIVGDITREKVLSSLKTIEDKWLRKQVNFPPIETNKINTNGKIYFVDIPNSKQSQLNIARLTVDGNDYNYLPITIANYQLGAGSHGYLNKKLRIEKGYTYGAGSYPVKRTKHSQLFTVSSVKTNVTKEAIETYFEVIDNYRTNYNSRDLEITKNSFLREAVRDYETLGNLIGILHNISTYNLPLDYISREQEIIKNISLEDTKSLIDDYIDPSEMTYIVVGDKATQFDRLKALGMGDPILLDKYGNKQKESDIKL